MDERGFTLLELMTVLMIIGILIGIVVPSLVAIRMRGYDAEAKSNLRNALNAAQTYYVDHNASYENMNANELDPIVAGIEYEDGAVQTDEDVYVSNVTDMTFTLSSRSRSGALYMINGSGTVITFNF